MHRIVPALVVCFAACLPAARSGPETPKKADDPPEGTAVVVAEGVGRDEKEARNSAFRNAVGQVVGTLVDAETLVKNDAVIGDRILEYSGGFIKTFDVQKTEKTADGLVRVRIKATVERVRIAGRLADVKVATKEVRGEDLLAEKMTREEAKKNATELLAKLHSDLPKMLKAEPKGKPQLTDARDGLAIDLVLSADAKAYEEYVKKATALLDKIATAKDSVLVSGEPTATGNGQLQYARPQFSALPALGQNTPKGYGVWMLTHIDGTARKMRWNFYWVDAEMAASLKPIAGEVRLQVQLNDKDGKLVAEDEVALFSGDANENLLRLYRPQVLPVNSWLLWNYSPRSYWVDREERKTCTLFVAPLISVLSTNDQREYQTAVAYRHKIKLTDADLGRVTQVKSFLQVHGGEFGRKP